VITVPDRHRRTDRRTDGRTDRRTTYDGNTALCTKVHRAVKTKDGKQIRQLMQHTLNCPHVKRAGFKKPMTIVSI